MYYFNRYNRGAGNLRCFPVLPVWAGNLQLSLFVLDADTGPAFLPLFFPADYLDFAGPFFVVGGVLDARFFNPDFGFVDCDGETGLTEEEMKRGRRMRKQQSLFPELDEVLKKRPLGDVWVSAARARPQKKTRWRNYARTDSRGYNGSNAIHDNNRGGDSVQEGATSLPADEPGAQLRGQLARGFFRRTGNERRAVEPFRKRSGIRLLQR